MHHLLCFNRFASKPKAVYSYRNNRLNGVTLALRGHRTHEEGTSMMQHARTRVDGAAWRGRRTLGLAGLTVVAVALAACSAGPGAGGTSGSGSGSTASTASSSALVIDSTFDLKTADPARSYEFTGELLAHNVY